MIFDHDTGVAVAPQYDIEGCTTNDRDQAAGIGADLTAGKTVPTPHLRERFTVSPPWVKITITCFKPQ